MFFLVLLCYCIIRISQSFRYINYQIYNVQAHKFNDVSRLSLHHECQMQRRLIYSATKELPAHNRDLTIPQRRCLWKRHWKIDSASFQTISPFSQVALLLKKREFRLELKRGGRARVQTEKAGALPFPSSKNLKLVISRHSRAGKAKKCTKKRCRCCRRCEMDWLDPWIKCLCPLEAKANVSA